MQQLKAGCKKREEEVFVFFQINLFFKYLFDGLNTGFLPLLKIDKVHLYAPNSNN